MDLSIHNGFIDDLEIILPFVALRTIYVKSFGMSVYAVVAI